MTSDQLRRLPPPPLFTIRPPPKPPGPLFENFQTVDILNGQCTRSIFDILNASSTVLPTHDEHINWLNLLLLALAVITVVSCCIIAIFIFICLKKLRKEEKQYKSYVTTDSWSIRSRHCRPDLCATANEQYRCTSNAFSCCDDYYSHQLTAMTGTPLSSDVSPDRITDAIAETDLPLVESKAGAIDNSQTHQYECIPECALTMSRHHHSSSICHNPQQVCCRYSACSVPYATFSRSLAVSRRMTAASASDGSQCTCSALPTTAVQEEPSAPLLLPPVYRPCHRNEEGLISVPKSTMIGWRRRGLTATAKRKSTGTSSNEERHGIIPQLKRSYLLQ